MKRTDGKKTSWTKYCKKCGDRVPVDNHMEDDGSLQAEKEEKEEANRSQKKVKAYAKPQVVSTSTKSAAAVTVAGTREKGT